MMKQLSKIISCVAALPINDIDTDQIIPARFLKITDKSGLGQNLFADWRYDENGDPKMDFVLNKPEFREAKILLAGENFGCGSSREHAPWALSAHGISVILAKSYADIFYNNALKNGILPIKINREEFNTLLDVLEEIPSVNISVDLATQTVHLPTQHEFLFEIDKFSKRCLLEGTDEMGILLGYSEQIDRYEQRIS
ncbi:MAG: 3-isopropylmalate dehydratase small subunit [Anaerolineaceae bacterium]|nr:3-isopropylmalate dehydratase small subunit [Anaerolineaceae bacterium]